MKPRIRSGAGASALIALTLLSAACAATAQATTGAPASTTAKTAAGWRTVLALPASRTGTADISAVVATGKTAGWAFPSSGAYAYQRTGPARWTKVALPARNGTVTAAAATSPDNVWAVYTLGSGARLLHWAGRQWTTVRSFPGLVTGISVLGPHDVWVFGGLEATSPADRGHGVWHDTAHGWTLAASTFSGGYARSDTDVWAYTGESAAHFDGRQWKTTSLARLMPAVPKGAALKSSVAVTGIVALAPGDVYATASGNEMPHGGPVAVLHFNGRGWVKTAQGPFISPVGQQLVPDGRGGLWIPASGADGNPRLLSYRAGKLSGVTLPEVSATTPAFAFSLSLIPGSDQVLAGGIRYLDGNARTEPVVLQSSP